MANRMRVGVVGASPGRWGVIAHLSALRRLPQFEVVGVATSRQESADRTAEDWGVPLAFSDAQALARHPQVDLVSVCVKVVDHFAIVMAALGAGKHVYSEWPLGVTTSQAVQMHDLAQRRGVHHMVGLQARGAPAINYVRDLVADGYLGQVLSCAMISSSGGWDSSLPLIHRYFTDPANGATALTIPGGHSIDVLRYCVSDFCSLSATVATQRKHVTIIETGEQIDTTSPDQVIVNGVLANGALASVHVNGGKQRGTHFLLEIGGTEGDLTLQSEDDMAVQVSQPSIWGARGDGLPLARLEVPDRYRLAPAGVLPGPSYNVAQLYARMAKSIEENRPVEPGFCTAVELHRVLDAVAQASASGRHQSLRKDCQDKF